MADIFIENEDPIPISRNLQNDSHGTATNQLLDENSLIRSLVGGGPGGLGPQGVIQQTLSSRSIATFFDESNQSIA